MAAVPVIINGVLMPKGKSADDKPVPAVFLGYASIQGLSVGGGPIIPPNSPPIEPPVDPPTEPPSGAGVAVVIKAAPETGGWGLATQPGGEMTWYFVPGQSGAGPKR
jgi:hypothetical protein